MAMAAASLLVLVEVPTVLLVAVVEPAQQRLRGLPVSQSSRRGEALERQGGRIRSKD